MISHGVPIVYMSVDVSVRATLAWLQSVFYEVRKAADVDYPIIVYGN